MSRHRPRTCARRRTLAGVPDEPVSLRLVLTRWWPLAASWALMGIELPLVGAVVARLANPDVSLAAYGGFVFPIALIIEAPIIMLLAASTALGRDMQAYRLMHRFMTVTSLGLTILHAILAFTPAFDLVLVTLLGPPDEVIEPARLGLAIMLPWTWTIAYRRFHQGFLIRFGQSGAVGVGTVVRLATVAVVTAATAFAGAPGIVVATCAIASGVTAEAIYTGWRTRPIVRGPLADAPLADEPLRWNAFGTFYMPLVLTSLLLLLVQPIGAAAMARMPVALASLAAFPVVNGLLFFFRSVGYAYAEVVVALMDRPGAEEALRRFTWILTVGSLVAPALVAATPASRFWFETLSGLRPELATLAQTAFLVGVAWAPLDVLRNYLQGRLVYARATRGVGESVAIFLATSAAGMVWGVMTQAGAGLTIAMAAFVVGTVAQVIWMAWRVRTDVG